MSATTMITIDPSLVGAWPRPIAGRGRPLSKNDEEQALFQCEARSVASAYACNVCNDTGLAGDVKTATLREDVPVVGG